MGPATTKPVRRPLKQIEIAITNSWKTKFNKEKLLKTNDEDREEDDGDNINNTNELEQETFDMDGNTYNINDFEQARQDAIANRQKK